MYINQYLLYIYTETLLYNTTAENFCTSFYRNLGIDKMKYFKTEEGFKHDEQQFNYDVSIDENQFFTYKCEITIYMFQKLCAKNGHNFGCVQYISIHACVLSPLLIHIPHMQILFIINYFLILRIFKYHSSLCRYS